MSTQTAKTTQNTNQSNDVFAIYKQNVQKCFESISKNTPQYFQTITHFQDECMKSAQKSFDAAKSVIVDSNKQIIQASSTQNQIAKTVMDATTQNVKAFNDNVNAFTDLNKNIIQSWITTCTPTRN